MDCPSDYIITVPIADQPPTILTIDSRQDGQR